MNQRPSRASKEEALRALKPVEDVPCPLQQSSGRGVIALKNARRMGKPGCTSSTSVLEALEALTSESLPSPPPLRKRLGLNDDTVSPSVPLHRSKSRGLPAQVRKQEVGSSGDSLGRRRQRREAENTLNRLRNVAIEDSGSSSDDSDYEDCRVSDEESSSFSSCNSSSAEEDDDSDLECLNDPVGDISSDGTIWRRINSAAPQTGRTPSHNVFRANAGLTAYSRRVSTPLEAWKLIIDDGFLRHIIRSTEEFAQQTVPLWSVSLDEVEKFIGLVYLRAAMNQSNFPTDLLWSDTVGMAAFRATMPRNRFRELKKFLRFDSKATRSERLQTDKFCMASWILHRFVHNSQKCYTPTENLCADEQLFPTKVRCRFIQYMPSKPDKFGIKFFILAEVDSKYCLNVLPYLGKDDQRVEQLGTHVVMTLMEPYFGLGYNITTDNFFTNKLLAEKLLARKTSIVGTIRAHRRELPPMPVLRLHESAFHENGKLNLVAYRAKTSKTVHLLSTMHEGAYCEPDGKRKPESVLYYNKTKCGVDILDSMCRMMSTKAACRRWPLAVFYNILDLAGINSWIVYRKATGSRISRRTFLFQLCEELTKVGIVTRTKETKGDMDFVDTKLATRVNCQVKVNCNRNRTSTLCSKCDLPVCGPCLANVCRKCDK